MKCARHVDDWRIIQESRHAFDVERRRHHDDAQIVAREPGLPRERKPEVGMNASLVKFIENDRREIRQQRILLKARRQNALGDDEQPRIARGTLFESNVPPDFAAERPLPFFRDAARDGARRDTPRLQQDDPSGVDERGRNAGRLAGAGRSGQHDRAAAREGVAHVRHVRVNNQREERSHRTQRQ